MVRLMSCPVGLKNELPKTPRAKSSGEKTSYVILICSDMSERTLYDKIWNSHKVATLPTGQDQIFIGLHLVHEVTSPQAFDMLREEGLKVAYPKRNFATVDHIVPTDRRARPFLDSQAETMMQRIENNVKEFGISFFGLDDHRQGIVHVIGPELGLTQPGMTVACGDSHTSTHGAFGSLAFGIGTTQVKNVLATQTLALDRLRVRKIVFNGKLPKGVWPKDMILSLIRKLGVQGGIGFAYEYSGSTVEAMDMEGRMTLCNMSIEGGALVGYVNPDERTSEYVRGREFAPSTEAFSRATEYWKSVVSDADAVYDDTQTIDVADMEPMVTWGTNPAQAIGIGETLPHPKDTPDPDVAQKAYDYMGLPAGKPLAGTPIEVAFVGSCTNSRISDLREAAKVAQGRKVKEGLRLAMVAPGSRSVQKQAVEEGLDKIFTDAGFSWREPGCSMCLAMNPDKLRGNERCATSSNRNFVGRQGSSTGRSFLMSPAMVVAAALEGKITDVRELL